jgi:para-aminobenzoate synthetase component I
MLNWANQFNICCFLDSHEYDLHPHAYECILAAGAIESFTASAGNAFEQLKNFSKNNNEWLFGHFSYDLKNEVESLHSDHTDYLGFPDTFFFIPETIIILNKKEVQISTASGKLEKELFSEILKQDFPAKATLSGFHMKSRFTKAEYLATIEQLQKHILIGDCYEINFCQEFYQENVNLRPVNSYFLLDEISPNPFAAFYKLKDKYLLCASPERYLWKKNDTIISQPMKGTSRRDLDSREEDQRIKERLHNSIKDKSENVMVVDLVRNDLSKVSKEGSVKVDELYAVYSFPHVHQMISTISGKAQQILHWTDYIKATFPMGSMTGAPKKRVMELIEQYERSRRGLFSGALGYVTPEGNFDFNVVIRSILYNSAKKYLSYQVGSAITFYSDPEKEYEECLLKAEAIKKVLT